MADLEREIPKSENISSGNLNLKFQWLQKKMFFCLKLCIIIVSNVQFGDTSIFYGYGESFKFKVIILHASSFKCIL